MAADPIDNNPTAAEQTKLWLLDGVMSSYHASKAAYSTLQTMLWANPLDLTPQQVCDAYGTRASSVVAIVAALTTYINAVKAKLASPGADIVNLKPANATVTSNADGTVTITYA